MAAYFQSLSPSYIIVWVKKSLVVCEDFVVVGVEKVSRQNFMFCQKVLKWNIPIAIHSKHIKNIYYVCLLWKN